MNTAATPQETQVIYQERQWVPWYWWLLAAALVALIAVQLAHNRNFWWGLIPGVVLGLVAAWVLINWSSTRLRVELDADGTRWLLAEKATLPADVVSRSLAVPKSAKKNAMGRQLDPAAFIVSHGWVRDMVMLVLDDPADPTPYWLLSCKDPAGLLRALVPEQAEEALVNMPAKDRA